MKVEAREFARRRLQERLQQLANTHGGVFPKDGRQLRKPERRPRTLRGLCGEIKLTLHYGRDQRDQRWCCPLLEVWGGKVLDTLDTKEALRLANEESGRKREETELKSRFPSVIAILSPDDGTKLMTAEVAVRYSIRTSSDEPVTSVRALVDGRAIEAVRGISAQATGGTGTEREMRLTLPERDCEGSIIAENRFTASEAAKYRDRSPRPSPLRRATGPARSQTRRARRQRSTQGKGARQNTAATHGHARTRRPTQLHRPPEPDHESRQRAALRAKLQRTSGGGSGERASNPAARERGNSGSSWRD